MHADPRAVCATSPFDAQHPVAPQTHAHAATCVHVGPCGQALTRDVHPSRLLPRPVCGRTQGAEEAVAWWGQGVPFLAGKGLSWRPRVSCRFQLRRRQEPEQPVREHPGLCQVTAPRTVWGWGPLRPGGAVRLGQPWEGRPGTAVGAGAYPVPRPGPGGLGQPQSCAVGAVGLDGQHRAGLRGSAVGQFRLCRGAGQWGSTGP